MLSILSVVPDRSSPTATWWSFIASVRAGDEEGAEMCWVAEDREVALEYDPDLPENHPDTVMAEEIYGDAARVLVGGSNAYSGLADFPEDFAMWVSLSRRGGLWLLTWDDRDVLRGVTRNWWTKTTRHFVYHYRDFHLSEELMESNERHFERVSSTLGVEIDGKLDCFLVGSERDEILLKGDLAIPDYAGPGYVVSGNDSLIHEINHVMNAELGGRALRFFDEGLAVYLESEDHTMKSVPVDILARDELSKGVFKGARDLMQPEVFNAAKLQKPDRYAVAASFVKYIVENYGMDRFKELYRQVSAGKRDEVFLRVLGEPLERVDKAWQEYLESVGL